MHAHAQAQVVTTGRSTSRKKAKLEEERFGEDEADWSVYREIVRVLSLAPADVAASPLM